jgi:hypothetical protein
MIPWPVALPSNFFVEGYSERVPETWVQTKMEVGIPRTRNRTRGAGVTPITGDLMLTKTQLQLLDDFFVGGLADGVLRFNWTDPRTKAPKQFRFAAPPAYEPVSPQVWRARIQLEELFPAPV